MLGTSYSPSQTVTPQSAPVSLLVDYENHPAFSMYPGPRARDTAFLDDIFREIDLHFRLLVRSDDVLSRQFIARYFRTQIEPLLGELLVASSSVAGPDSWYADVLPKTTKMVGKILLEEAVYRNENKVHAKQTFGAANSGLGTELTQTGCGFLKLPQEILSEIWRELQPVAHEVREMRRQIDWEVATKPIKHEGRPWDLTMDLLRSSGVFAALRELHGCEMGVYNWCLSQSSTVESWYKDCYVDVGLPTSRTAYMHWDNGFNVVKMIMYLGDVGPKLGPFSVIPRSKDFIPSQSQAVYLKYMDWFADPKAYADPKFNVRHRRRRYKIPELRQQLMKLPNQIRGSSHFGEDILDGTPQSEALLRSEVVCLSDITNCIIFDGACTVHRGGLVQEGERWALQMAFRRPDIKE